MCFALNLYLSHHIYPPVLCGCHLYLFISLTALLSLGHRRPGAPAPKTDPFDFSPLFQLLFSWKCFPSAFFLHLQRDRHIGAGGSELRGLLSHWWLSSHPSIRFLSSPFSSPCPLWGAGGIPPLGLAGHFQGKYEGLSSAPVSSRSAWLRLSIAVISKAENLQCRPWAGHIPNWFSHTGCLTGPKRSCQAVSPSIHTHSFVIQFLPLAIEVSCLR